MFSHLTEWEGTRHCLDQNVKDAATSGLELERGSGNGREGLVVFEQFQTGVLAICSSARLYCSLRQENHELKASQGQISRLESRELEACYF